MTSPWASRLRSSMTTCPPCALISEQLCLICNDVPRTSSLMALPVLHFQPKSKPSRHQDIWFHQGHSVGSDRYFSSGTERTAVKPSAAEFSNDKRTLVTSAWSGSDLNLLARKALTSQAATGELMHFTMALC